MEAVKFVLFIVGMTILCVTLASLLIGSTLIIGRHFGIYGVAAIAISISCITVYALKKEFFD